MVKILCTGNPDHIGIAMEIKKLFPDASFVSRTTGYDLTTKEGLDKLRAILKNYNVFINNAHIQRNTQITLLSMVREEWETGHVFNIGTLDEYKKWLPANPENYEEATRMKELGFELTNEHFKVTHITVGGFKSSSKPRGLPYGLDPMHIAKTIKWVMEAEFEVPIISVDQSSDWIRNYMYQRQQGLI